LSTFFASPAVKIHQIKKHVLFNSRPLVPENDKLYCCRAHEGKA
jgi:hypothetical protein